MIYNKNICAHGTVRLRLRCWPRMVIAIEKGGDGRPGAKECCRRCRTDASAVVYVDMQCDRRQIFLAQLLHWAPKPPADADYAQFVQETGFDYERDLDRVALAINDETQNSTLYAIADGRFDRKKIEAYRIAILFR